jgi:hypothetical protein
LTGAALKESLLPQKYRGQTANLISLNVRMKSETEIVQEAFDLGWDAALEDAARAIGIA